jgi:outer membrane lipoprotein SlyB
MSTENSANTPASKPDPDGRQGAQQQSSHALEQGLGAIAGGALGAAVGKGLGGNAKAAVGAIAGAVAGGLVGEALADDLQEKEQQAMQLLGLAADEGELPAHYSWEDLQQLSRPQSDQF